MYNEWRESLHAYLANHQPLLVRVLLAVEEFGKTPFKPQDVRELAEDFNLNTEEVIELKGVLYSQIVKYTGGPVRSSARRLEVA